MQSLNFKPGTLEKFRFTYEVLDKLTPASSIPLYFRLWGNFSRTTLRSMPPFRRRPVL